MFDGSVIRFVDGRIGAIDIGITNGRNLAELLAFLGNEDAISLRPMFVRHPEVPNVVIVPILDKGATCMYSSRGN